MHDAILTGVRVLVLEDDALINLCLVEMLESLGCRVSAFMQLHQAKAAVEKEAPDVALLDVNLQGNTTSYDLAAELQERGVPVVFLTGYDISGMDEKWRNHPMLQKPCTQADLRGVVVNALTAKQPQEKA